LFAFFAIACQFFTVAEAKIQRHITPRKTSFRGFYDAKIEKDLLKPAPALSYTLNYP
jgi:hypothetical protein